jgi:transposase
MSATRCPTWKGKRGRIKRSKARNLLERLTRYEEDVLRFMENPLVPFTNNRGENDIRMTKVQQKYQAAFGAKKALKYFAVFGVISRPVANNRSMHHRL